MTDDDSNAEEVDPSLSLTHGFTLLLTEKEMIGSLAI